MHRYWYGLFPEEYSQNLYDQDWISKYSDEIVVALDLLDNFLEELIKYCHQSERSLILVSSMGQMANEKLTETPKYLYKLVNVDKLLTKLCHGKKYEYQVDAAMIPQYSLSFNSTVEAQECFATISETKKYTKDIWLEIDINDNVLTISTNLSAYEDRFFIKGQSYSYDDLGYQQLSIEAHHTARHCPEGTLIIYNSKTSSASKNTVNYLEYAPAMLKFFGVETSTHMLEPQFTI